MLLTLCVGNCPSASFVFASRHGELQRTVALLQNLANDEALSPNLFSLSVLNSGPSSFRLPATTMHRPRPFQQVSKASVLACLKRTFVPRAAPEQPVVLRLCRCRCTPSRSAINVATRTRFFALGMLIDARGSLRFACVETQRARSAKVIRPLQAEACLTHWSKAAAVGLLNSVAGTGH